MPIVRLPQGELRDEIRQPIYDSIEYDGVDVPVSGVSEFFNNIPGKNYPIDTNLKQSKLLETAVSFRVQGLCLDAQNIDTLNQSVLPTLLERSSIELVIGEKTYWTGQARLAAGRMWQHTANPAAPVMLQQAGSAAIQPVILMGRHVIDINPLQSFFARWTRGAYASAAEETAATPQADTFVRFMFSLKGLLRRPVQ